MLTLPNFKETFSKSSLVIDDLPAMTVHSISLTGFPAVPQNNFPWLLVKNIPFFPDKNAEKGQFFPDSRWKWTFFSWSKRGFFCICNKIFFPAFKQHYYQLYISQCADFSDYNDYLEDPPWLGPTRKFLKIGIQRLAKNHQIQGILERNSLTFKGFNKNSLTFPGFPWLFLKTAPFPGFPWPLGTL